MNEVTSSNQTGPILPVAPMPAGCPVTVYLANELTTGASRRGMVSNLRRAARVLSSGQTDDPTLINWVALTNPAIARMRTLMVEAGAAPATVNATLAGVKGVLKAAWRLNLITSDQYLRAVDVKAARGSREPAGRVLAAAEQRSILVACCDDASPAGARDAAIIGLMLGAGLRREEVVSMQAGDYTPTDDPELGQLVVTGKGNKQRVVYIHNGAKEALEGWLAVRGDCAGAMFIPIRRNGAMVTSSAGMTGQAIALMLTKRAEAAGVASCSPHDCRRTYISTLLDGGVDISTAAALAGHASVDTTRIYDRRGDRAKRAAAGSVCIPYHRPA